MVRDEIKKIIEKAAKELGLKVSKVLIEEPKEKNYGDYSTNVALTLAKNPMEVASALTKVMADEKIFEKIEVVRPGFINFFLSQEYLQKQISEIFKNKNKYGNLKIGKKEKVNVEFISANPTGPLTLGNGRGGFGGDVLSNVLEKSGYDVTREFYINDRGKQIEDLKKGLYKGEKRTADQIQKENQKLIIKKLKIKFDVWFSEKNLYKNKEVDKTLALLKKKKLTYEKERALWFKSTKFGDDKDRVLIRENGGKTYFASDVAYLKNKFERGFKKVIIFVGADHHGYIERIKAAAQALGHKKEQVDFIVMQMVSIKEKGERIKMSKRAGKYIALEQLVKEVGLDAARFFFLARAANSHLIFDLELAKKKSQENPVYYVQYAHARICSILRKSEMLGGPTSQGGRTSFKLLVHSAELALIKQLIRFPEIIEDIAKDYQVQRIPQYAIDLAESFHRFYQECQVISDDKEKTKSRIALITATQIVLKNTLNLMGITTPEKM
jgi:arginyl-tRNA synthetase